VLYVNSDTNARGFLRAGGSHSFQSLVNEVAGGIRDPETGVSVLERVRAKIIVGGNPKSAEDDDKKVAKLMSGSRTVPLRALGSGSDYTPFLQHLGVASLDIRYGGEDDNEGVYHSIYDSFDHYVRFGDPEFAYGVALASTIGRVMMRAADAEVVPMRFGDVADTIGQYVEEVHKLADSLRESTDRKNKMIDENLFKLAADPTETYVPPKREAVVPFINFAPLDNALLHLKKSAKDCDTALGSIGKSDRRLTDKQLERVNELLLGAEQRLTSSAGLPGRDWYRHMIYAPGLYTGYGAKTLPAIREALELRRWPEADRYVTVVANVLEEYTRHLDGITALVK
jgi:N-acetylated-alpha-linked acidic dipeptidase